MKFLSLHGYVVNGKSKIESPKDLQNILKQLEEVPEVRVLMIWLFVVKLRQYTLMLI